MKSIIFIACLILSASAAPQKTAGLEREAEKSGKLQFSPADAQVYSRGSPVVLPQTVAAVDQVIAGNVAVPQVYGLADQVIPQGYYAQGAQVIPGVINTVYGPAGVVPYSSVGRTTVTSTSQNGLPTGTVYEHTGTSHIGHLATAVHVRKPGQLYAANPLYTSQYYANGLVGAVGAPVPSHLIPQSSWSQSWFNGQVQAIAGQPAQYLNGNWYYVNAAVLPQQVPLVNQYSSVYNNLAGRVNVLPAQQIPQTYYNAGRTVIQPATTAWNAQPATAWNAQPAVAYRPAAQDSKWYTKTNTQQVVQPFYGQPQYAAQIPAAAGTKSYAVPKPADSEAEKADW